MDSWDKSDFTIIKDEWQDDVEDVEDAWDAEEEEEVKPVVQEKKASAPKKAPAQAKQAEAFVEKEETELERKLRLQKIQEDADHDNAVALFGSDFISSSASKPSEEFKEKTKVVVKQVDWLESLDPATLKDFDAISDHLAKALRKFDSSKHYIQFVENLSKALLLNKDVPEVRKVSGTLSDLAALKQKEKTAAAKKKAAPTLGGAKKGGNAYADYDDFDDDGDGFD